MTGTPDGRSGRGWAYTGVVLGAVVSIAANVAASFIPPTNAAAGWVPPTGAVVSAVFWPVLLMVAVELFARIGWPPGWRWLLLRGAGLLPVAVIAAVVSYRHLSALLRSYGEDKLTSMLGPVAVDGLMVMAAGALLASSASRTPDPPATTPQAVSDRSGEPSPNRTDRHTQPPPGRSADRRTDAELVAAVRQVPRDADGTVPVRRAAKALGTGPDRARRLLREAGLLHTGPHPEPVPVPDRPDTAPGRGTGGDLP